MKYVADYDSDLGDLAPRVGVRGRALAEMATLDLPVPPGFAVSDVACRRFLETGDLPVDAWEEVTAALERSHSKMQSIEPDRPVLFSVRSSPAIEMPGLFNSASPRRD